MSIAVTIKKNPAWLVLPPCGFLLFYLYEKTIFHKAVFTAAFFLFLYSFLSVFFFYYLKLLAPFFLFHFVYLLYMFNYAFIIILYCYFFFAVTVYKNRPQRIFFIDRLFQSKLLYYVK